MIKKKGGIMLCAIFVAASLFSMAGAGFDLHALKKGFVASYQDWQEHLSDKQRWLDDKMADWEKKKPKERVFWWQGLLRSSFGRSPTPSALRNTPKESDVAAKLSELQGRLKDSKTAGLRATLLRYQMHLVDVLCALGEQERNRELKLMEQSSVFSVVVQTVKGRS